MEAYLAIARASGIGVPLNPHLSEAKLSYLLDSGATGVITSSAQLSQVRRMLPERPWLSTVVIGSGNVLEGITRYETLAATEPDA